MGHGAFSRLFCWIVCLSYLFLPSQSRAADPALTAWLAAQTNIQTWSAEVIQTRTLKTLAQPLTNTGHIWFAAPNRFRWEIGSPAQTIAVRQAVEMLVIYPRLKRAERYPLDGELKSQWKEMLDLLEAGFPRSQSDLETRFKMLSLTSSNDVHRVALQPRSPAARRMMPQITITFSTIGFALRATELQFADGSTLRNEFRNAILNPKLDAGAFEAKLGDDYKIVEPLKK
ncbi:MAG TPA: outer membrane lipoprotein carrier protein LolA [Verrucomicrobiae bacterium]|jgi:outer membrane lipoprotein-sorting protein